MADKISLYFPSIKIILVFFAKSRKSGDLLPLFNKKLKRPGRLQYNKTKCKKLRCRGLPMSRVEFATESSL